MNPVSNTALILIDVQAGIDNAHWGNNRNNPDAEQNISLLLKHWREKDLPVIIVQHCSVSPNSPFRPGDPGNDLKEFVRVLSGDKLIQKSATSAFCNTALFGYLKLKAITGLVITGFVTNNSVESTARQAGDLGFNTIVVSDATACFDKKGIDGSIYRSDLIHQISLSNLEGEYANVMTTLEVIASLNL